MTGAGGVCFVVEDVLLDSRTEDVLAGVDVVTGEFVIVNVLAALWMTGAAKVGTPLLKLAESMPKSTALTTLS